MKYNTARDLGALERLMSLQENLMLNYWLAGNRTENAGLSEPCLRLATVSRRQLRQLLQLLALMPHRISGRPGVQIESRLWKELDLCIEGDLYPGFLQAIYRIEKIILSQYRRFLRGYAISDSLVTLLIRNQERQRQNIMQQLTDCICPPN